MPQPRTAIVCPRRADAQQIIQGTFHAQSAWENGGQTRIGCNGGVHDHFRADDAGFGQKRRMDEIACRFRGAAVLAPERQQASALRTDVLGGERPILVVEATGPHW